MLHISVQQQCVCLSCLCQILPGCVNTHDNVHVSAHLTSCASLLLLLLLLLFLPFLTHTGRGQHSHAYTHSVQMNHHVFLNLETLRFYCLPDNYEIIDPSLEDIKVSALAMHVYTSVCVSLFIFFLLIVHLSSSIHQRAYC